MITPLNFLLTYTNDTSHMCRPLREEDLPGILILGSLAYNDDTVFHTCVDHDQRRLLFIIPPPPPPPGPKVKEVKVIFGLRTIFPLGTQ